MSNLDQLVQKYDITGPRYTSYPPVPFWKDIPTKNEWQGQVVNCYKATEGVDLYIHIPFCEKICHYCGCNRVLGDHQTVVEQYLNYLSKELDIYCELIPNLKISSLHLGGGTPTFLTVKQLEQLLKRVAKNLASDFIGSIELKPSVTTLEHLALLKDFGFRRMSIGVQDLNDQVLKAINRNATVSDVVALYKNLRSLNFESINFDLIYGLPGQSEESVLKTFNMVAELSPDMLAYYGFAFLPDRLENQKNIMISDLPNATLKKRLFDLGQEILHAHEYLSIGLDHFAKKENYLAQAFLNRQLKRNFMGYTDKKSNVMLALGASSISNTPSAFVQNPKEIKKYFNFIDHDGVFEVGHKLSSEDVLISQIIHDVMCTGEAKINDFMLDHEQKSKLLEMQQDGLLTLKDTSILLTEIGMKFSRNVAMVFDPYLKKQTRPMFSRTV